MDDLPIRRLSRLGNEAHLSASIAVSALGKGRYELGVVALLLLSRCVEDWVRDSAIARPASTDHYMSIRAIAQSLDAPYASIHRYVLALQAQGTVVATTKGYAISNDPAVAPAIVAFLIAAHDRVLRLIEDLAPDLAPDAAVRRAGDAPRISLVAEIVSAALDIWLIPYEVAREPVTDWTSKLVWIVIVVANVRHITVDDARSRRYAYEPTPDAMRTPLTVRKIADIAGLSYGTVFRHCRKLAQQDVIRYDRGGWLLISRQLDDDDVDRGVRAILAYYAKRIGELAALGLDTSRIGSCYLVGRPEYASINLGESVAEGPCQAPAALVLRTTRSCL